MFLAIVIPFMDEEEHLSRTLASIAAQERPPDRLLIVDDGSSDGSGAIADAFAAEHDYATALHRPPKPPARDRLAQAGELVAFTWAVEQLDPGWDVVAKLDADVELPACALGHLLERLGGDETLGMAGTFLEEDGERITIPATHVHGATKFYRRACWDQIAPLPPILGWDTIDELRAEMHGWGVRSFALPCGDPLHLRPRASHDGDLRGIRRFGECAYSFGDSAPIALLESLRRVPRRPLVLGGANYAAGWASAALHRRPRAEPELRAYVRRQQWGRIRTRLRGFPARRWTKRRS